MNLTASLVVRNELRRYLPLCVEHLLAFCDTVVVLDDDSDDGTREWLVDHPDERLHVVLNAKPTFWRHEGQIRQMLLDSTLALQPTHVLQVDADEFVSDGSRLRVLLAEDSKRPVWSLAMREVWTVGTELGVREDGGWRSHAVPVLWRAPERPDGKWRIRDRVLACGREPVPVIAGSGRARDAGVDLLHFGWADPATRVARHARYAEADGGRFHTSKHLASILWEDARVVVRERPWPAGPVFDRLRDRFAVTAC